MPRVASLAVEVSAETGGAVGALNDLNQTLTGLSGQASGSGLGDAFKGFLGANLVMKAVDEMKSLGSEALGAYSDFERLGKSLETLQAREIVAAGGAQNMQKAMAAAAPQAAGLLKWIEKLAIQSPFSQSGVSSALNTAKAYGFVGDSAKRVTQDLIDFAAGMGGSSDVMNQVALALGQIQAKGKLAGQEVLQLVNAGLPVYSILANAFGKTTAEIIQMQEKGLIPAGQAIEAILASIERDFGGAAAAQANTFSGLTSSLEDLKEIGLREFFTGTFQGIQPYVKEFVDTLGSDEFRGKLRAIGNDFGQSAVQIAQGASDAVDWFTKLDKGTRDFLLTVGGVALIGPSVVNTLAGITGGLVGIAGATSTGILGIGKFLEAFKVAFNASSGLSLTTALGVAGVPPAAFILTAVGAWIAAGAKMVEVASTIQKGREAVRDALSKHQSDVFTTSKTWEEYRDKVTDAFRIAGYEVRGNGSEITIWQRNTNGALHNVSNEFDMLSESTYRAATATDWIRNYSIGPLGTTATQASLSLQTMAGQMDGLQSATANAQTAFDNLAQAQANLESAQQSYLTNTASQFESVLGQKLPESSERYKLGLGAIDDVMGSNLLGTYNLNKEMEGLVTKFASTGDIEAFKTGLQTMADEGLTKATEKMGAAYDQADKLFRTLVGMPKELSINVKLNVPELPAWMASGITIPQQFGPATPNNYFDEWVAEDDDEPRAAGGVTQRGHRYWVGEEGPEPFIPAVDGRILSVAQAQAALAMSATPGVQTINTIESGAIMVVAAPEQDPYQIAMVVLEEIQKRL